MRIALRDTATSKWKDKGNGGTTGNLTSGTVVSSSAISTFGIMTLADKFCTTLKPVVSATDVTCPGNSDGIVRVSPKGATPPYTYSWSPRPGASVALWDLISGMYNVTVTDARGCTIMDSIEVNDPDSIELTVNVTDSDCHDSVGTARVIASGGSGPNYSYFWIPNGEHTDSIWGLPAGIYKLIVRDEKGCSVDTTFCVSDSNGTAVEIDSLVNVDCNGSNTGFARIIFSGDDEHDPLWPCNVPNPDKIAAGSYPVLMEDEDGCFTAINVVITEPSPISLTTSTTESDCGDSTGSATVVATGGTGSFTYSWSSGGNSSTKSNLSSGFDTVFVTDENGCSAKSVVFIDDSDGPSITASVTHVNCFDGNNGCISVSVSGGNSPYSYLWSPGGESSSSIDSLFSSNYFVVVTDSNNCKSGEIFTVSMPEILLAQLYTTLPTSDSLDDGSAFVEAKGGTTPYTYYWTLEDQTSPFIENLGFGDVLNVTITDDNGCTRQIFGGPYSNQCLDPNGGWGCHGPSPSLDPVDFSGYCFDNIICTSSPICTLSIADFGAVPDDLISDECAFEAASDYINYGLCANGITNFVLTFEAGIYDIGRQDDFGILYPPVNCSTCTIANQCIDPTHNTIGNCCRYKKGHDIFRLENIGRNCNLNVTFSGAPLVNGNPSTIFRFVDCMLYGSFDPVTGERYLPCLSVGFSHCAYSAYPGSMFSILNSDNITIKNLELDGNVGNFSIGGYFSSAADGIQLPFDGILLNNSSSIVIENVNAHDFGRDGLIQQGGSIITDINLHLLNSKFNRNRRMGFSWSSGQGVFAKGCDFSSNGIGSFSSMMRAGLDIEWEGGSDVGSGYFHSCTFMYNALAGVICDAPSYDGLASRHHDFTFEKCKFVGSQYGSAIRPTGRDFKFICCDFYGICEYAYNGYHDWNLSNHPNKHNAKFSFCNFYEEYTDNANNTYSFTRSTTSNPSACVSSTNGAPSLMLDFFSEPGNGPACGRVEFNQCNFRTGYFNQFGNFKGNWTFHFDQFPPNDPLCLNDQVFTNCSFTNNGMNATNARILGRFEFSKFVGTIEVNYPKPQFTLPRNWGSACYWIEFVDVEPSYRILLNCQQPTGLEIPVPGAHIPFASTCYSKYVNPTTFFWQLKSNNACISSTIDDPDLLPQYCINDFPTYIDPPQACDESNQGPQERMQKEQEESKNKIIVYPVPSGNEIWLKNIVIGETAIIYNIVGEEVIIINFSNEMQLIDISHFVTGIYYLKTSNGSTAKIVKY